MGQIVGAFTGANYINNADLTAAEPTGVRVESGRYIKYDYVLCEITKRVRKFVRSRSKFYCREKRIWVFPK